MKLTQMPLLLLLLPLFVFPTVLTMVATVAAAEAAASVLIPCFIFIFSQTTLVSGSPFLPPLNGEELPTGNDLSQTPWGRAKFFSLLLLLFFFVSLRTYSKLEI